MCRSRLPASPIGDARRFSQILVGFVILTLTCTSAAAPTTTSSQSSTPSTSCGSWFRVCGDGNGFNVEQLDGCGTQQQTSAVQMSRLRVESTVQARYSHTVVSSTVTNAAYSSQSFNFSFVVPQSSRVTKFTLEQNGVKFVSQPLMKGDTTLSGPTPLSAKVSFRDASRFVVRLTLEARSEVTFSLEYEELLARKLSKYTSKLHLQPGQIVPDLLVVLKINEGTDLSLLELHPFTNDEYSATQTTATVTALANGYAEVRYQPTVTEQIEMAQLFQEDPSTGINGYLAVSYDVLRYPAGGEIFVNGNHFVHFFSPAVSTSIAKHALFVLDVSGSMQGTKIEQLRDALVSILAYLDPRDSFTVIEFSSSVSVWDLDGGATTTCHAYQATSGRVTSALARARAMGASGGTSMNGGLLKALECARLVQSQSDLDPILLLLTDGQPTDASTSQILASVAAANAAHANIYSLAFGKDADIVFLHTLSSGNGGEAHVIQEGKDAASQLNDFYKTISTPLLLNVSVTYDKAEAASLTQSGFRQYFRGSELVIAGRLSPASSGQLSGMVTATGSDHTAVYYPVKSTAGASWTPIDGTPVLERLWAMLTLSQWLEEEAYPASPPTASTARSAAAALHSDSAAEDGGASLAASTSAPSASLALQYSFITPSTCLELNAIFTTPAPTTRRPTTPRTARPLSTTASPSPPETTTQDPSSSSPRIAATAVLVASAMLMAAERVAL